AVCIAVTAGKIQAITAMETRMPNILEEALDEIYPEFQNQAQGGYGENLKDLISGMLESCEADMPLIDIEAQFTGLLSDLETLQDMLKERVADKILASTP